MAQSLRNPKHGYRKLWADQTDSEHVREQGRRLAETILERKAREPGRRIVVVGHSAGCGVALAAGDALPMDAVNRMILLAPSVSTGYDVRPTLWSSREGVDVFCSKKDWVALGFVVRVVGTTDRSRMSPRKRSMAHLLPSCTGPNGSSSSPNSSPSPARRAAASWPGD